MKIYYKIFCLTLILMLSVSLIGCQSKKDDFTKEEVNSIIDEIKNGENDSQQKSEDDIIEQKDGESVNKDEPSYSKTEQLAVDFITALSKEDYSTIRALTGLENAEFVTDNDIKKYYITNGDDKLLGTNIEIKDVSVENDGEYRNYKIEYSGERESLNTFKGAMKLNEVDWKIEIPGLYLENWEVVTPRNSKVLIDGINIDKYYVGENGNYSDEYRIPVVSLTNKKITIENSMGEYTKEIFPQNVDGGASAIRYRASKDVEVEAHSQYIEALNEIMSAAYDSKDLAEVNKYFAPKISTDAKTSLYDGAKSRHNDKRVSKVSVGQSVITDSLVISDDVIKLYVYSDYNWKYILTEREQFERSMKLNHVVVLRKIDGQYLIEEMGNEGRALSHLNEFTRDEQWEPVNK